MRYESSTRMTYTSDPSLTIGEESLLKSAFGPDAEVARSCESISPRRLPSVDSPPSLSMEFSWGFHHETLLLIGFSALPAVFLKKVTEEAAKDFWLSLKRVLERVSKRSTTRAIQSIQVQAPIDAVPAVALGISLTYPNAVQSSDDSWLLFVDNAQVVIASAVTQCREDAAINATRFQGKKMTIHAVFDPSKGVRVITEIE